LSHLVDAIITVGDKCQGANFQKMSDEVEEFVSRFPRKPTPSNSVEDLFEIQHTGEWNYQIEGGGTKIFIDGYRDRTILEAKYVSTPAAPIFRIRKSQISFARKSSSKFEMNFGA
jgi:hypothetical protein